MKAITRALTDAARSLAASSDTARLDAELLLAEAFGIDRDRLLLSPPNCDIPDRFWGMVERRSAGEPLSYITGRRAFWNIEVHVGPGALIPRPDSELLIFCALQHFEGTSGPRRVLDLGTGPGTLLLAALDIWPLATGLGIDRSRQAMSYAAANARRLGLDGRVELRLGDWADGIQEAFDLVLCNPPYVADGAKTGPGVAEHEPAEALYAGRDGLDCIRRLAPEFPRLVAPEGLVAVEIGYDQGRAAATILGRDGLRAKVAQDLGNRDRAVLLTRV